jgi:hypothetical protein
MIRPTVTFQTKDWFVDMEDLELTEVGDMTNTKNITALSIPDLRELMDRLEERNAEYTFAIDQIQDFIYQIEDAEELQTGEQPAGYKGFPGHLQE